MSTSVSGARTNAEPAPPQDARGRLAVWIRRLSVPIILGWLAIIAILNITVPQLEVVGQQQSVSMSSEDAPSMIAMKRIGKVFEEFNSDSSAMIVLEGEQPLGDEARRFYGEIVDKLEADTQHVEHVQDFWGDPLTATGAQSPDGKAAYVQVYTAGNQGEAEANESIAAVQDLVAGVPAPDGVTAYVTGPAALMADQQIAADRSLKLIEAVTFTIIFVMLMLVFRSIVTMFLVIAMVVGSLFAARGVVAFLGYHQIIGLSVFATNLLVTLGIAAATDYAIFLIGRYQEARGYGQSREQAYYTMFHGTAHVVLGSGLTIAGATFCLQFTRLPYFQTLAVPLSIGMVVIVAVALTLGSAMVVVASRFGLLEPKRKLRVRAWRRIGAAVVRWPGPILIATIALALVGLLTLPGYETNYNDRNYLPKDIPAAEGYAAAERHFDPARLNPELVMVESDQDLRNPADFLVIERIAKAIFGVDGVARVQTITRPQGTPIENTSLAYQMGMQGVSSQLNKKYQENLLANTLKQAQDMDKNIADMERMSAITTEMAGLMQEMVSKMDTMVGSIEDLRDGIADFDDFFRPFRNYLYWEPHCFDIPVCWALRSVFDTLDGIDTMTADFKELTPIMHRLAALMPEMVTLMPSMIENLKTQRTMLLTQYATQKGQQDQQAAMQDDENAMGEAFNEARNDDSFYLPPEAFQNAEFKRGMDMFLSPDGHAIRFMVTHEGDPMSSEGISRVEPIENAVAKAIKGSPLEGSRIYMAGTASMFKDMSDGNRYDLLIAAIAALSLIFIIMVIITRAVVAAVVIVGTVVLSLGSAFGLSILIWQHLLGIELHWMVLAMSVIILLAVGADYNLLVVARLKEEVHAGVKTGIIRTMGGSGSVVTAAGLVFAFTMMGMSVSELTVLSQVGTTIGLGLLFDTLVVRAFMTPSIAALLGRWFWWPQMVRTRPTPQPWPQPTQLTSV
ncbi:MMPL family transporter [Mycolicibacterium novocastrense]|uniref:MMPL family transporter n=1 Tax=Mycolicibacterium novocastrense TaxID=59813 RepID=A0AAW5SLM5_MYCNV|nr:MMPL family transporter [Mycolicibacterium novocastrense]MCV7024406.1 MMPL family transporter [Mycolicibacterium novocastrense]GAT12936.1 transmembrane transport protein MmpL1 [Mycolicibacterium novocastrense]